MLQAALPNGFRLRMLPRSVPAVFRQTGEIFYIGGADVLPAPLERPGGGGRDRRAFRSGKRDGKERADRTQSAPCRLHCTEI